MFSTSALAAKSVLAVATRALVAALDPPRIDASQDAVVHEHTSADAIGGGSPANPVRSYFQTDSVSLRLRWPISWARRAPAAAAVVADVTW